MDDELQVWLSVVVQRLVELFQRHGAVETYLPLLVPETTLLSAFPDLTPVRMLDQNGKIVQLPSSGLMGMARTAARRNLERIKRYHIGYRFANHPAGGQPRASGDLTYVTAVLSSFVLSAHPDLTSCHLCDQLWLKRSFSMSWTRSYRSSEV